MSLDLEACTPRGLTRVGRWLKCESCDQDIQEWMKWRLRPFAAGDSSRQQEMAWPSSLNTLLP